MQESPPALFSYAQILSAHARACTLHENPLMLAAHTRLAERVAEVTRTFQSALVLAPWSEELNHQFFEHRSCQHIHAISGRDMFSSRDDNLNLPQNHYDAIVSCLSLSAVNDLPGILSQLYRALKPDGMLLISLLGGETLHELRSAFSAVETKLLGGIQPHVHPFIDVRDAGALLQRAGFNLPVIDRDVITVTYPHAFALMHELRALGATNSLHARARLFTRRDVMMQMAKHYAEHFACDDGNIRASLEIITLVGWKPHANQPKPLARGSAKHSLKQALEN